MFPHSLSSARENKTALILSQQRWKFAEGRESEGGDISASRTAEVIQLREVEKLRKCDSDSFV